MQPQEFVNKWANTALGELQSGQAHFLDVCRLLDVEMPGGDGKTETGETFVFEQPLQKASGHGRADVYYENHFAVEYKGADKYPDLNAAYQQLLQYRENLKNPPLLVVTDINHWEIHTNFPNTQKRVYSFKHSDIASDPNVRAWLEAMFRDPMRLHPRRNTEQVTKEAAQVFRLIADNMREWEADPRRIAYFLTKLVFCLFAEDVGLLPTAAEGPRGIFTHIIEEARGKPAVFKRYVQNLFVAMNEGGNILMRDIPYFNGTLFKVVTVADLSIEALEALAKAAPLNWAAIEPSIFGTLFERSLDPSKRAQLGAHYTSREDILLIIEPVLMQPLRDEWTTVQLEAEKFRGRYDSAKTGRAKTNARNQLLAWRERILERIRQTTVLDPACGSGNFLYVSLQMLMDLEKEVIQHPLWTGLQMPTPEVHPRQMYGIELDPIAHALASIVVWIGYIQWRQDNGYGQAFKEPILEELEDNIVCKDAILPPIQPPIPRPLPPQGREGELSTGKPAKRDESPLPLYGGGGLGVGVNWPAVDVIVGNPPFLGDKLMRSELEGDYVDRLRSYYQGRVPGGADLVTYWFENAREQIQNGQAERAGLLATNSIRGGANRKVLSRIKNTGDIFMAWSDRDWILDGAAVRVSMIGFDSGDEKSRALDGLPVAKINSDLTSTVDITASSALNENTDLAFIGSQKGGGFDISADVAKSLLNVVNQSGYDNNDVVKPWVNGADIVRRPRDMWIIDFGPYMPLEDARKYNGPFKHVEENVQPARKGLRRKNHRVYWWIHAESRPGMRDAVRNVERFICTSRVSKHRVFVWLDVKVLPDSATVAIARDDDYFFGVLHSKLHETWSLRMGTWLGKGNDPRYTPTTTFETFPFPWSPGNEDRSHPAHAAISAAAKQLHEERQAWLNPPPIPRPLPPQRREGEKARESWKISPELEQRMQAVARELRKNPTPAEEALWQAIRKKQLDGRKFRRQVAIGAFVVDFYCSTERLVVEVDGPIHDQQDEADRIRQELIESLGIRFVRLTNEDVEQDLESSLNAIRQTYADEPAKDDESPLPLYGGGGLGVGAKSLKDRTLTNLYNALQVFRGRDSMKTKPAAADFVPRLHELHRALDEAVCDAYGWEYAVLDDEEEILRRLLALNLERAG